MKNKLSKLVLTLSLVFCLNYSASSQIEFMHSAGVTYKAFVNSGGFFGMPQLTYNPRLNFPFSENMSLSATTYASLGFSGSINSQSSSSLALGFDLPVLAQLNFGHHATKDSDGKLGGHVAAGYGLGFLTASSAGSILYHGPAINGGMKFAVADRVSLGVRLSYQYALALNSHVIGVGVLYNF